MPFLELPPLPAPLAELPNLLEKHQDTPIGELFAPYRQYEARVRQIYSQEPGHPALADPLINVLPLYPDAETPGKLTVRARNPAAEAELERSRYILPLPDDNRRPHGAPAVVPSLKTFREQFSIFTESSLSEIDWSNVVVCGSAVVNCLLPVPDKYNKSRRSMREYFHEKFCPASDVDLFLYGLTEEQAVEKIQHIENAVRDSILAETTTVRTKNAITICSQYPTRHVQIVLRIYKSVSEILTGFDIDCSGAAYDGKQVYCTPRALQSYLTQVNHIDLSRRSPSYENRLSKYSHRNFEVYWSELDRSRIDPTVIDRSFKHVKGLARLLVLEKLPTPKARYDYANMCRDERGRPRLPVNYVLEVEAEATGLRANIKDQFDDEIAEWEFQDDVSGYDTFVIPYGQKYNAKKIEKLCFKTDLLLNAEWNEKSARDVYLHRHPAFFGHVSDVIHDCCGSCPKPKTEEEIKQAEEDNKKYISGEITFLKDDPGRQEIGSFNPVTDDDWTEMAYISPTERLCQAITEGDLDYVQKWVKQDGVDPNARDYTGRTPLHLAVISSTVEVVQCLVDNGARLVARLADGRTALHLAALRGDPTIVKIIMDKSLANEEKEGDKAVLQRQAKEQETPASKKRKHREDDGMDEDEDEDEDQEDEDEDEDEDENDDVEMIDMDDSDDGIVMSVTTTSFVEVTAPKDDDAGTMLDETEPDFYDVNIPAWDLPCSALHLAILSGHEDVVKLLCQEYGADVLRSVNFTIPDNYNNPNTAVLNLVLALALPQDKAQSMARLLIDLGATSSQADLESCTALHHYVTNGLVGPLETLLEHDKTGVARAINHVCLGRGGVYNVIGANPLMEALGLGNTPVAQKLLDAGAAVQVDFSLWLKSARHTPSLATRVANNSMDQNRKLFESSTEQPLIKALYSKAPLIALELLRRGADPSTKTVNYLKYLEPEARDALLLVRENLRSLREYDGEKPRNVKNPENEPGNEPENADEFLASLEKGSWLHWVASEDVRLKRASIEKRRNEYKEAVQKLETADGIATKREVIATLIKEFEEIEKVLEEKLHEEKPVEEKVDVPNKYAPVPWKVDYKYEPNFIFAADASGVREEALIKLFDAAWKGDLDTIKELTLSAWGPNKEQPPLEVAVFDRRGISPLFLAYLQGHQDTFMGILDIARLQYKPREKPAYEFHAPADVCDYSDSDSDDDSDIDEMGTRVDKKTVQFTVDNIGEVNMQAQGKHTSINYLSYKMPSYFVEDGQIKLIDDSYDTLFAFAIIDNDPKQLKFLLDASEHFGRLEPAGPHGQKQSAFKEADFSFAISYGRTEMLAEIIKRTGVALPLEQLVAESGIKRDVKPRYYQGLTVYGEKRRDWANAGYGQSLPRLASTPPVMLAVTDKSLASVEWFFSDAPLRNYLAFANSNTGSKDKRVQQLKQTPLGIERVISRWLHRYDEILLHKAIATGDQNDIMPLAKFLVKAVPSSLTTKTAGGYTPLLLAAYKGHVDLVKMLLENGADPRQRRDGTLENLLHAALTYCPKSNELRTFLKVFTTDDRKRMLGERDAQGQTPLHRWLLDVLEQSLRRDSLATKEYSTTESVLEVIKVLLEESDGSGHELRMLDGSGKSLLHAVVRHDSNLASTSGHAEIVRGLLEMDPIGQPQQLLQLEDSTGRTVMEVARDQFVNGFFVPYKKLMGSWWYNSVEPFIRLIHQPPTWFLETLREPYPFMERTRYPSYRETALASSIWLTIVEFAAQHRGRRQLVGLQQVNEVAKRVEKTKWKAAQHPVKVKAEEKKENGEDKEGAEQIKFLATFMEGLDIRFAGTTWGRDDVGYY